MRSGKPRIDIGLQVEAGDWPPRPHLRRLVRRAIDALARTGGIGHGVSELGVVFTDDAHVRRLNAEWRGRDRPTNVLSFPAFPERRGGALPPMLGDVVLAFETVKGEADLEAKPLDHHICHLLVHGLLHLLGHDHEDERQAEEMEELERAALARLAIPDPYA
jgi:probable rRNA maturation factor